MNVQVPPSFLFFFNDPATTEIYTLSLHDALPISRKYDLPQRRGDAFSDPRKAREVLARPHQRDRKSTRLNSSHSQISYAVFCLKKKKNDPHTLLLLLQHLLILSLHLLVFPRLHLY